MSDPVTPSQLRAGIYRLIDRVLATGEPLEIDRRGQRLLLAAETTGSKVDRLRPLPDLVVDDADDLVHHDWSDEWDPDQPGPDQPGPDQSVPR